MAYGMNDRVGISFQDSFGTSLVDSMHWIEQADEGLGIDIPPLVATGMRGVFDEGAHYEGPHMVGGAISAEANPLSVGVLLAAVLGKPTTVTSDGLYTHTFKPRTADWDVYAANVPATVHRYLDVGSAQILYDLVGSQLELTLAAGQFLMAKVDFLGGKISDVAAIAASYPTGKLFTWNQASFSIGTSAQPWLTQLTFRDNETLEAGHTLNNALTPSRVKRRGFRSMQIDGVMKFDTQAEYREFRSQSERELIVTLTGATQVQSGYYESLELKVPLLRHTVFKPVGGGPGEVAVSFSSKGVYSVDSAVAAQITLVNTLAGY